MRQAFEEGSISCTLVFEWKSKNEIEKGEASQEQRQGHAHNFVLAGQTVKSTYYCDVLRWQRLTLPFSPGNFLQKKNMSVIPHPLYSLDFAPCNSSLFP
jgi:hypothetical protein